MVKKVKKYGSHNIAVLISNPCYNKVCYKETTRYMTVHILPFYFSVDFLRERNMLLQVLHIMRSWRRTLVPVILTHQVLFITLKQKRLTILMNDILL